MQILLYDDKEMRIFDIIGYFPEEIQPTELDTTTIEDSCSRRAIFPNSTYRVEIHTGEAKAELDPTTMKRIAKYNLDKDLEELNKKIKQAKNKLKELENQEQEKSDKLVLIGELFVRIWNDRHFNRNNYIPGECDYQEDEW